MGNSTSASAGFTLLELLAAVASDLRTFEAGFLNYASDMGRFPHRSGVDE